VKQAGRKGHRRFPGYSASVPLFAETIAEHASTRKVVGQRVALWQFELPSIDPKLP
jgi:hypothetical protein